MFHDSSTANIASPSLCKCYCDVKNYDTRFEIAENDAAKQNLCDVNKSKVTIRLKEFEKC